MRTCPACGASAPVESVWCGLCYATFPPAPASPVAAADDGLAAAVAPVATLVAPPIAPPVAPPPVPAARVGVPLRPVLVAAAAIAFGGVMYGIATTLGHDTNLSPATGIRYDMVLTLALYAVVGVLVVVQLSRHPRLRWTDGRPALGVAIGLLVGGTLSGVLLAVVSAAAGHLDPDPRAVLLMSEGDAAHIVAVVLITCIAAPLIEETVFRGLLLESLRPLGRGAAIWLSALAFAVWHFAPSALRYYAVLGSLLGLLYLKRGLACSMAAHFAFNAVLTGAALSVVLSPGPGVDVAGLSVHLPGGWRTTAGVGDIVGPVRPDAAFDGPSDATLAVATMHVPAQLSLDHVVSQLDAAYGMQSTESRSMRELTLPVGTVLEMQARVEGAPATLAVIPHGTTLYLLELHPNGSVKASVDFQRILRDLTVS